MVARGELLILDWPNHLALSHCGEIGVDVEPLYSVGALLAYCGQKDAALRSLRRAVEKNYCAYTALQTDPLLVSLRGTPEFSDLLALAKQCQDKFLTQRSQLTQ